MGYADHVRSSVKPLCWGEGGSYDPNDSECSECRFHHSCELEINRGGHRVRVNTEPSYRRTEYRSRNAVDMGEGGTQQSGIIEEGETPIHRFAKDAIGGGLRGMFYEMWQFWRHYRIR